MGLTYTNGKDSRNFDWQDVVNYLFGVGCIYFFGIEQCFLFGEQVGCWTSSAFGGDEGRCGGGEFRNPTQTTSNTN